MPVRWVPSMSLLDLHEGILLEFAEAARKGRRPRCRLELPVRWRPAPETFDERPLEEQAADLEVRRQARMAEDRRRTIRRKSHRKPWSEMTLAERRTWNGYKMAWRRRDVTRASEQRAKHRASMSDFWKDIELRARRA
jgi:hypothetical protein